MKTNNVIALLIILCIASFVIGYGIKTIMTQTPNPVEETTVGISNSTIIIGSTKIIIDDSTADVKLLFKDTQIIYNGKTIAIPDLNFTVTWEQLFEIERHILGKMDQD